LGCLAFLGVLGLWKAGLLQSLELTVYDAALGLLPAAPPDRRIVLIGETEADIQRWGHPLSDEVLADVLERLLRGQPRVIGVDKYRDAPLPPGSERLAALLRERSSIIWIMKFGNPVAGEPPIAPPAPLRESGRVGFSDLPVDPDGKIRRGLLYLDDGRQVATGFALAVALAYLSPEGVFPQADLRCPECLRLGKTTLPPLAANDGAYAKVDDAGYQLLLDYRGVLPAARIHTLSEVLDDRLPREELADRIVLVGAMAESLRDYLSVPPRRVTDAPVAAPLWDSAGQLAGIALHALIVEQLLRLALEGGILIQGFGAAVNLFWSWMWCLAGAGLALCQLRLTRFMVVAAVLLAGLLGVWYGSWLAMRWLPLVAPILGFGLAAASSTVYLSARDHAEKKVLMSLFARHVAPEVAATIWRERKRFVASGRLLPQRLTATVLFTDIRGFTTVAETLEPARLMDWLNIYMDAMTQVVMDHGGVVNKYIGDAVMGLFGVPAPRQTAAEIAEDATQAVRCALAMGERLRSLNARWAAQGLPAIAMRVGIYTGPLVAGSLGGRQRLEYTVLGDTVNIASRLESFDKDAYHVAGGVCRVLIGESTLRHLHDRFQVEAVGRVKLKGKNQEIAVYRVDGPVLERVRD
jgi:adenylate cyclase